MKLKLYAATSLIFFASCASDDKKDYTDKSIMPTAEEKAASEKNAATSTVLPANTTMPANMQQQMQQQIQQQMQQPQQQAGSITLPGGKSITVPAGPVSITPNQANAVQQNNVVMTPVQTPAQPTAPGMNPPHGQPGHRCDIAVGAPLNSKPAPPANTTGTTVSQPQVTMTEVPTKTKTAPGMNPPHGEAGHRCDIAVGAPLNSKPAATTTPATVTAAPPPLVVPAKTDSVKN